jgi:ATP-binding cassette subfamily A (ABC1) protein 3
VKALNTYIDEYLLRFGAKNMQEYIRHYQLGFTAERDPSSGSSVFTVWYSSQFYHICPSALSAFHNTYMNYLLTRYNVSRSTSSVTFVNHPLPRTQEGLVAPVVASLSGLTLATYLSFALSLVLSGFVLFIVQERASKAKHLQFVSGVRNSIYWMANLIWDCGICVVNIAVICIIVGGFRVEEFSDQNFLALFTLLVLFCWSGLSLVYTASSFFTCHLFAFASMMVTLSVNPIMVTIKKAVKYVDPDTAQSMHRWFLMHPSYAFSDGLGKLYINGVVKKICDVNSTLVRKECAKNGIEFVDSVFTMSEVGIGEQLVALATVGAVLWAIFLIVANSKYLKAIVRKFACKIRSLSKDNEDEDDDVVEERDRVKAMKILDCRDVVTIEEVTKVYHSCHKRSSKTCRKRVTTAVNNISVGIGGECFGLLGNNGAGKTTTFKILTGDLNPTSGTAFIAGDDIRKNTKGAQQHLGYCPQFDALLERMTGEELLTMFCRLRGIPEKKIPHVVKTEIKRLDLEKYAKKRCGTYSGGNKRKLSTAIALVGSPPIILLDEPTTGMDPNARRHLWNALTELVAVGKSIVLTSHSMEECEALCTRLAIMVNGEFKSLGSAQHLKNKFGEGLTLVVKTNPAAGARGDLTSSTILSNSSAQGGLSSLSRSSGPTNQIPPNLVNFINQTFPGSVLLESHQGSTTYQLPSEGLSWSFILQQIEENKAVLGIEDYSISQTTLEQVFLTFAQEQLED